MQTPTDVRSCLNVTVNFDTILLAKSSLWVKRRHTEGFAPATDVERALDDARLLDQFYDYARPVVLATMPIKPFVNVAEDGGLDGLDIMVWDAVLQHLGINRTYYMNVPGVVSMIDQVRT